MTLNEKLAHLARFDTDNSGKDFLLTWDHSLPELQQTLLVADILKQAHQQNISTRIFDSGLAVSQFRDNSTRTRFSFASAANLIGLTVQDLDEAKSQIAHGETVRETANMISFLTEIIGIRDDMYLGMGHQYMKEVGQALSDGFKEGVLPKRPGVINLQCDIDHPTQSMSDLLHLSNHFGGVDKLAGKKIAMSWAYSPSYGKPLSVPQGIIGLLTRFGMNVTLAHPPGYSLIPEITDLAQQQARASNGQFSITEDINEAFENADIVYPKSWAPYAVMEERTTLLQQNNTQGLTQLEKECLAKNANYQSWTCTQELMKKTRAGKALYMHCLPADITGVSCEKGEVQKEVFEQYRVETYKEAGYKPFIIAAMMLGYLSPNISKTLKQTIQRETQRRQFI